MKNLLLLLIVITGLSGCTSIEDPMESIDATRNEHLVKEKAKDSFHKECSNLKQLSCDLAVDCYEECSNSLFTDGTAYCQARYMARLLKCSGAGWR